jgi:hypothetical protein
MTLFSGKNDLRERHGWSRGRLYSGALVQSIEQSIREVAFFADVPRAGDTKFLTNVPRPAKIGLPPGWQFDVEAVHLRTSEPVDSPRIREFLRSSSADLVCWYNDEEFCVVPAAVAYDEFVEARLHMQENLNYGARMELRAPRFDGPAFHAWCFFEGWLYRGYKY